jgi:hypothetical protein
MIDQSSVLNSDCVRNFLLFPTFVLYIVAFVNILHWKMETDCVIIISYELLISGIICLIMAFITTLYCCCLSCETFTIELKYDNLPDKQPIS